MLKGQQQNQREFVSSTKRMDDLNAWLKRDTDRIFEDIQRMQAITTKSEETVRIYTQIVEKLQSCENRNDEFMQKLLNETATLKITKLEIDRYEIDHSKFESRLDGFD
jgi:hypothetical protein